MLLVKEILDFQSFSMPIFPSSGGYIAKHFIEESVNVIVDVSKYFHGV